MEPLAEHRVAPRRPSALPGVVDYDPHKYDGTWWQSFEVTAEDVSERGVRFRTLEPVERGAHVRLIVPPVHVEQPGTDEGGEGRPVENLVEVEGDIVWVKPPLIPRWGRYRAGVAFRPPAQPGIRRLLEVSAARLALTP